MVLKAEQEIFPKIVKRFENIDRNNRKVVHVFKLKLKQNGTVVKTMMADLVQVKFYEGDTDAECTMIIEDDLFCDIANKKVDALEALKEGKYEIEGNVELLAKLKEAILTLPS